MVWVLKNPPAITGDLGSIPGSGRSPGGGYDNSLQCSCLEDPMDRGAWWATVHGITKSQTRLKQLSTQVLRVWDIMFEFHPVNKTNLRHCTEKKIAFNSWFFILNYHCLVIKNETFANNPLIRLTDEASFPDDSIWVRMSNASEPGSVQSERGRWGFSGSCVRFLGEGPLLESSLGRELGCVSRTGMACILSTGLGQEYIRCIKFLKQALIKSSNVISRKEDCSLLVIGRYSLVHQSMNATDFNTCPVNLLIKSHGLVSLAGISVSPPTPRWQKLDPHLLCNRSPQQRNFICKTRSLFLEVIEVYLI